MAFQIKDFQSIVAAMINYVRGTTTKLTDFNRGSVVRTMLEAPAIEMDQLYQQLLHGVNEGTLAGVFRTFEFDALPGETIEQQRERFGAYILTLARATVQAVEYGAKTAQVGAERVVYATAHEPYLDNPAEPVGVIDLYIHNGSGSTSGALVAEAQKIVDGYYDGNTPVPGWKAAGVLLTTYAAADRTIDVQYDLTYKSGYDEPTVEAAADAVIQEFINSWPIGKDLDMDCMDSEVARVVGVQCTNRVLPAADVVVDVDEKLLPGTITL